MKYIDKVYGGVEIGEPLVLEIMEAACFRRLKGIDQAGYLPLYANPKSLPLSQLQHNRFDHSVGVFILLKKFNASLEEQVSGLLHDLSHSAFSHCIDYVFDEGSETEQSYQDDIFADFVRTTKIPSILEKYNFDLDYILNEENFPLLEKKLPDLCADRIDYSLRSATHFQETNTKEIKYFLDSLAIENNRWVFNDLKSAKKYALLFSNLNKNYYAGLSSAIMFRTVGDAMKHAIEKEYISKDDLWTTEDEVLAKVEKYKEKDLKMSLFLDRMNNKISFENNPNDYYARVFCKSRIVDPLFKESDSIKRLSEVDGGWAEFVEKESKPKEYFIKFSR
ncbi:HD domain-containing protein [Patescibacteria group bacterium]|nr:HD domain-containing protein [Patescibacteria group bacterium]MBU2579430.1 HD domain-containing protein [Patescibacteria group bacterium]MCG2809741.1 HD domain-containing protein [Candidatus Portnoybacteria bacterium]